MHLMKHIYIEGSRYVNHWNYGIRAWFDSW